MEPRYSNLNSQGKLIFLLSKNWIVLLSLGIPMLIQFIEEEYWKGLILLGVLIVIILVGSIVEILAHDKQLIFKPRWERIHRDITSRIRLFLELHNTPTTEYRKSTVTIISSRTGRSILRVIVRGEKVIITCRGNMAFPYSVLSWWQYSRLVSKCLTYNGYVKEI
ncbi:hypothetical protein TDB9533_03165 [Thalassocella blandensis]|nr:hypothetical protein TDB9533_03165 [Thalassocella blandensis]